ncbi:hypothetical protein HKBW3S43_01211, partial [Candidatus Hakubella thermalkaliphila]
TSHENYVIFKGIAHAPRRTTSHENWVIFKGVYIEDDEKSQENFLFL